MLSTFQSQKKFFEMIKTKTLDHLKMWIFAWVGIFNEGDIGSSLVAGKYTPQKQYGLMCSWPQFKEALYCVLGCHGSATAGRT
jgi:hypothetical protein